MNTQYFIDKFEAIPEEKWCTNELLNTQGQSCANGHCGVRGQRVTVINFVKGMHSFVRFISTKESEALYDVFSKLGVKIPPNYTSADGKYSLTAAAINNGDCAEYQQPTPKQRILAALRDIQALEMGENAIEQTKQIIADGNRRSKNNEMLVQPRVSGSDIWASDESTQREHKRSGILHSLFPFL